MTITPEIGQSRFVEAILVTPRGGETCIANVSLGTSKWQNPFNRFDVTNSGDVTQNDYDTLVDFIRANGTGRLPPGKLKSQPYVDVSGDGFVTTRDLGQLAEFLNSGKVVDASAESCYSVNSYDIHRDLYDPAVIQTAKDVAIRIGATPTAQFHVFLRDIRTQEMTEIQMSDPIRNKHSVCFISVDLIECPVCGPNIGASGCDLEACIFRLLGSSLSGQSGALRCGAVCTVDGRPLLDPNCYRREILPSRDVAGYDANPCGSEDAPEVIPEIPTAVQRLQRSVIIAIYDEATEYYSDFFAENAAGQQRAWDIAYGGSPQSRYDADKQNWIDLITGQAYDLGIKVRFGLIQPYHLSRTLRPDGGLDVWPVLCSTCDYPPDSDRSESDHILLPGPTDLWHPRTNPDGVDVRTPRVYADEIVDMFNTVTSNGNYSPTFLMFILDNSGSVYVKDYRAELEAAKARIRAEHEGIEILDDLITEIPERWIYTATEAMRNVIAAALKSG